MSEPTKKAEPMVLAIKYLPSKPLAPLWWWLYLEMVQRVFDLGSFAMGALYTVLVIAAITNTYSFFAQTEAEPQWVNNGRHK